MRNLFLAIIFMVAMAISFAIKAEPLLNSGPGYISQPIYSRTGDPPTYNAGMAGFDYDGLGNLYVIANNRYIIKNPGQPSETILFDYGSEKWGSFLKVFGNTVYFGESSDGTVKSVSTAGGAASDLFTLVYNYDCTFNSQSQMFLSANPTGSNDIYYWDTQTEPMVVAEVGGASGPIAFDNSNDLYYGFPNYSPYPGDVVYFDSADLATAIATGTPLTSSDWTLLTSGVDPSAYFVFDPTQDLFSSYGPFDPESGTITRIYGDGSFIPFASCNRAVGALRFLAGEKDFKPFTPAGGTLCSLCTDYGDYISTIFSIEPCFQNFIMEAGDYVVDGRSEIAIFRPSIGLWAIRDISRIYFGGEGDLPVSGDYDGDNLAEPAIFRPSTGLWVISGVSRIYYGTEADIPVPRDYDNDGSGDIAIFQPDNGLWAIRGITRAYFGAEGDFPVPEDYDNDGLPDPAIFRPASGLWAIRDISSFYFGTRGDLPVPADYDGDGTVQAAIYRPETGLWSVRDVTRIYFGSPGDWPIPMDYDGDGTSEQCIFRPASSLWAVKGVTRAYFGAQGDSPVSR